MMERINIDKTIKAKSIEKASRVFAEHLTRNGYEWVAEEVVECVANGYYCQSNAMEHNLPKEKVTHPTSSDWSYYWAVEEIDDGKYYAWFIERMEEN